MMTLTSTTASEKRRQTIRRETYDIVRDYSEYSTIQGVIYLFQSNQTKCGKMFWLLVVIGMLILGTYWSVTAYNDWISNPVLTTVKTSAFKIKNLEFPALTICGQGANADIISAGFFKIFFNYTKQRNISYGMSPLRSLKIWKTPDNKKTPEEMAKFQKFFGLLTNDTDYIMGGYLDRYMPGFKSTDPLVDISPLLASMDPDDVIRMSAFSDEMSTPCLNTRFNESRCQSGFSMDLKGDNCYKALDGTRSVWDAMTVACNDFGASLAGFSADNEVQGLIQLIQNGKTCWATHWKIIIHSYVRNLL